MTPDRDRAEAAGAGDPPGNAGFELRILSGARAGSRATFVQDTVAIGRHPDSALALDAAADLDVSAHHAVIVRDAERWWLQDMGSRNGTFLNGTRIDRATALEDGDRIRLGTGGPELEFRTEAAGSAPVTSTRTRPARAAPELSATGVLRVQLGRRIGRLRAALVVATVLLAASIAALLLTERRQHQRLARETASWQARLDSVLADNERMVRSLEGQVTGLAEALRHAEAEVLDARAALQLAESRGAAGEARALRDELGAAVAALERHQFAASVDFDAVQRENRHAVAMVYVDFGQGEIATGTAFTVRSDAVLVTSRHVVTGPDGSATPRRIAIQFTDSEQVWPGTVMSVADDADLALIRAENILGETPVIRALNMRPDTLPGGSPVALLGFPLGGGLQAGGATPARVARPVLSAGTVTAVSAREVELQGYGAAGASGSPVFDRNGEVVAVLFGGVPGTEPPVLLAAPARAAARLLELSGRIP